MRSSWMIAAISLALAACANSLNERTAQKYYAAGEQAAGQGDLAAARENYRRALINTQIGNLGPEYESQAAAKLARIQGNLCEYEEANKTFLFALGAKEKVVGSESPATFPLRVELAQLSFDTGHYSEAVSYYEKALAVGGSMLAAKAPLDYAEILDDYAASLAYTGKKNESESVKLQAENLRKNSGATHEAIVKLKSAYVPYPKVCR